ILFKGEDITGLKPYEICRRRLARTFQAVNLFFDMTAFENVLIAARFGAQEKKAPAGKEALNFLEVVGLAAKAGIPAKDLTVAEQKRLEIARAMATRPDLLLLDEVMAGLNATEVTSVLELIRDIREKGITLFLIEHIMHAIMGISDRIIVLHYGEKMAEGTPEQITTNRKVIEVYLGE
ncbi:MAG: ATP-binding cassette domain-containing protein, partial [Deltaproteobacteria bacterium]|nr:ATP-binding cassette domain-containing protein [Deltaproteobacteria bacterium]